MLHFALAYCTPRSNHSSSSRNSGPDRMEAKKFSRNRELAVVPTDWRVHPCSSSRMLKKSLCSPAQPRRDKTRLFPYGVLASLRGSPYRAGCRHRLFALLRPCRRNGASWRAGVGRVRILAFFKHPAGTFSFCPRRVVHRSSARAEMVFPQPARDARHSASVETLPDGMDFYIRGLGDHTARRPDFHLR